MEILFSDIIKGNYDAEKIYKLKYDATICYEGCCHRDIIREVKITNIHKNSINCTDINNHYRYTIPINKIYTIKG